jgi:hypothetical protein
MVLQRTRDFYALVSQPKIYFSMYKIDVKILPYVTTPIFWGWVRSLGLGGNALEQGQGHCWGEG